MERIQHLKNYKKIKEDIDFGENVIVITRWAFYNTKAKMLASSFEHWFYECESEKAILFTNEFKDLKIWIPKAHVLYYNKDKSPEITKMYAPIE